MSVAAAQDLLVSALRHCLALVDRFTPSWIQQPALRYINEAQKELATSKLLTSVLLYFALFGAFYLLSYPISFIRVLLNFTPLAYPFKLKLSKFKPRNASEGPSWVVITGPTGELGIEFARQLAQKGFSIFLIGRNADKLKDLASQLATESPQNKYELHALDLEKPTEEDWTALEQQLAALPGKITVLINNAGISHRRFVQFERTEIEDLIRIPAVNIVAVLRITRMIVPKMVDDRRGLILNIGSFSAHVPAPLLATYGGSKAFIYTWSQALGAQLDLKGVNVRVLNTYYVTTQMSRMKKSLLVPSARTYVKSALYTLGLPGGAVGKAYVSTPFIGHAIAQWFTDRFWSEWWWMRIVLRDEQIMLRKSINKRREKEGMDPIPLDLKQYRKEVIRSVSAKKS